MKKSSCIVGLCLLSAGAGILLSIFLPLSILVCIQALLLILAGLLCLKC